MLKSQKIILFSQFADIAIGVACAAASIYFVSKGKTVLAASLGASGLFSFAMAYVKPAQWILRKMLATSQQSKGSSRV